MSHRSLRFRLFYLLALGALLLPALLLRTLSLYGCLDEIGYFDGSVLPTLTNILLALGAIGALLCPFLFFKRGELTVRTSATPADKIASAFAILALSAATVLLLTTIRETEQPPLTVLGVLALLCGIGYFACRIKGCSPALSLLAFGAILGAILIISLTYFDLFVPMNSPHKLSLHLCLLTAALYLLYEMRAAASVPFPRVLIATASLCALLTVAMSGANLLLALRTYVGATYTAGNLLAFAVGINAACRLGSLLLTAPADQGEPEEENA